MEVYNRLPGACSRVRPFLALLGRKTVQSQKIPVLRQHDMLFRCVPKHGTQFTEVAGAQDTV